MEASSHLSTSSDWHDKGHEASALERDRMQIEYLLEVSSLRIPDMHNRDAACRRKSGYFVLCQKDTLRLYIQI